MKKQDVIDHFGSIKKTADAIGCWPQAVYQWGDDVPENVAYKIQVITNGELMVETKENE